MVKALILSAAILSIWLAAGAARAPVAPVRATGFPVASISLEPGMRGPVVQV